MVLLLILNELVEMFCVVDARILLFMMGMEAG